MALQPRHGCCGLCQRDLVPSLLCLHNQLLPPLELLLHGVKGLTH